MNLLHIKYALEVAKTGSLGKASEVLLIAPPNISRSIKTLEADLGITIFERSAKGMDLTPEGEEFINIAKGILGQIDEVEKYYKNGAPKKYKFSVSAPHSAYISEAFARFSNSLSLNAAEIFYEETNSKCTIRHVQEQDYKLGIIRYPESYDRHFKTLLEEKGLCYEMVTEVSYVLIMSSDNPLSQKENLFLADLKGYIEIFHADPYVPSIPLSQIVKEEYPHQDNRRIFVSDRASQLDLLSINHQTFMWDSSLPTGLLERYNLVEKKCLDHKKIYKDVLIYNDGYVLSGLDRRFITELCESKRKYL